MRRIVALVEGDGDCQAVPKLISRICQKENLSNIYIDETPIRIGGYAGLLKDNYNSLKRHINNALRRKECDRILLLLDGDSKRIAGKEFCVKQAVAEILSIAQSEGAGNRYEFDVVFAMQEFESWIIAGLPESIVTQPNDEISIKSLPNVDFSKLEDAPRDAKKALSYSMTCSYKENIHQVRFVKVLDLDLISARMKSFRKMYRAVTKLCG
jgi:hypothetical protein